MEGTETGTAEEVGACIGILFHGLCILHDGIIVVHNRLLVVSSEDTCMESGPEMVYILVRNVIIRVSY